MNSPLGLGVDFINWFTLCAKLLRSAPTFTPEKASQKFGAECKMVSHPTFSLYEINPWMDWFKGVRKNTYLWCFLYDILFVYWSLMLDQPLQDFGFILQIAFVHNGNLVPEIDQSRKLVERIICCQFYVENSDETNLEDVSLAEKSDLECDVVWTAGAVHHGHSRQNLGSPVRIPPKILVELKKDMQPIVQTWGWCERCLFLKLMQSGSCGEATSKKWI